ncbi:MAG TPA: DUF6544 family protein [Anaerolineaceae bacterium]
MAAFFKALLILASIIGVMAVVIWAGLRVQPRPFAPVALQPGSIRVVPVPQDLPAPVQRFYATVYGSEMPVIESVVISGRAKIRPAGPFYLPARFRFTHLSGQGYRHYIEATFFGIPVFRVDERYVDGKTLFELPFGVTGDNPNSRQGANLGLWAETIWTPSVYLNDPRVRWEAVDEYTALLHVPFEGGSEQFVVRFDPATGLIRMMEAMRYKDEKSTAKVLWITDSREWGDLNGLLTLKVGALTWMDAGTPWAIFTVEDIQMNSDVREYLTRKGP